MPTETALRILMIEGPQGQIGRLLQTAAGFEILPAERLTSAVRIMSAQAEANRPCDALVLDVTASTSVAAPKDHALDTFRLARAFFPETPIVILGDGAESTVFEAMILEGAQAFLPKEGLSASALATAVKQAVLRFRSETSRFRSLFDSAPIGILLAVGRRVVMANPEALASLGRGNLELSRLSILELFPSESHPLLENALDADGISGSQETAFDVNLPRPDGTFQRCRIHLKGALLNNAPAVALYLTSLAGQADQGYSLAGAGRLSLQAQKMEALGRLAGGAAHDFNNLLTAINGYSEHLLTLTGDSVPVNRGLNAIRRAGEAAVDLTRRLLTFSRSEPADADPISCDGTLAALRPTLEQLLGPRIGLRMELAMPHFALCLPPALLEKILRNLCLNAMEAMPQGGTVTVTTGPWQAGADPEYTHLAGSRAPDLVMTVEDTGQGMDQDTLERLCEPFFSSKRGGRGTGLGLANVYGIVNQMGGGIAISSHPGRGTRFRIFLPAAGVVAKSNESVATRSSMPARDSQAHSPAGSEAESGTGSTILVVDDDSSLRDMLGTVLGRCGYTVVEAASVPEALDIVQARAEGIDLVLTDVMLRGEGGHELGAKLQMLRPGLRTIYISGHSLETLADRGITLPAEAFLEKPFTPTKLAAKVRTMLDAARSGS